MKTMNPLSSVISLVSAPSALRNYTEEMSRPSHDQSIHGKSQQSENNSKRSQVSSAKSPTQNLEKKLKKFNEDK